MKKNISASDAAAAMGRVKSPAKTTAARSNGAKGGRPRQDTILARAYEVTRAGQIEMALVRTLKGNLLYAVNGRVNNARAFVGLDDARTFWDAAPYQEGPRP